ncbi:hypothetical protein B0T19DRAFT_86576 [Cercophora scortea]|uniref:Uncharacterized protein n=1 Tax=Cercophora scortea TaxID=314031 RepID=A0AAE0MGK1_9PEZI|nr:hypothetical protein B0T19DRAFT_86576 [Cercophora scortea]
MTLFCDLWQPTASMCNDGAVICFFLVMNCREPAAAQPEEAVWSSQRRVTSAISAIARQLALPTRPGHRVRAQPRPSVHCPVSTAHMFRASWSGLGLSSSSSSASETPTDPSRWFRHLGRDGPKQAAPPVPVPPPTPRPAVPRGMPWRLVGGWVD